MKKYLRILSGTTAVLSIAGCATTTVTETEFAADGVSVSRVKTTETNESPLVLIAQNSGNKHWVVHAGGWNATAGYADWGFGLKSYDITASSVVAKVADADAKSDGAVVAEKFSALVGESKYSLGLSKEGVSSEGGGILKAQTDCVQK